MKKRLMMAMALILATMLLSSCSMLPMLYLQGARNDHTQNVPVVEEDEALDGEVYYESAMEAMAPSGKTAFMDAAMAPMPMPEFNTEEYAAVTENGFQLVSTSPLSTFSADVDTASYCNLRRMLNDDWSRDNIPSGAVRIEEMLNYFRYDYAKPKGDDRFGVTAQLAACPWNPEATLLLLGVRAADAPSIADEGSNLVFLVDVSGSMDSQNKLGLVKRALTLLIDNLGEKDTLSIVTYASGEDIVIDGADPAKDRTQLIAAIESLNASGSTNGERGLQQAYDVAQRHFRPHGNNRVIMCSDGDLNVGITSQSDLHDFVSGKRETGIYLSVLGFGDGNYKDTKMETLADDGNGSYYYIDSILEARKVLVEELTQTLYAVADDVKFQIEFNPAKVSAYRQVGYENRALDDQDFENDRKDAGEVGAGACVTVMYELIPAAEGDADGKLRYQTSELTEAAQGDEWLTVSMRYKDPGEAASKLQQTVVTDDAVTDDPSGDFLFAAAVAEFGLVLKNSEYRGDVGYPDVIALLKQAPLSDEYREEFFSLVKIAQRAEALAR